MRSRNCQYEASKGFSSLWRLFSISKNHFPCDLHIISVYMFRMEKGRNAGKHFLKPQLPVMTNE
jgi:hypothetical protein